MHQGCLVIKPLSVITALLAIAGCSTPAYTPPSEQQTIARQLKPVSAEHATLYFLRTKAVPFWFGADVLHVDGAVAGSIKNGGFLQVGLEPGVRTLVLPLWRQLPPIHLTARAGEVYFVQVVHATRATGAYVTFQEISGEEAESIIADLSLEVSFAKVL